MQQQMTCSFGFMGTAGRVRESGRRGIRWTRVVNRKRSRIARASRGRIPSHRIRQEPNHFMRRFQPGGVGSAKRIPTASPSCGRRQVVCVEVSTQLRLSLPPLPYSGGCHVTQPMRNPESAFEFIRNLLYCHRIPKTMFMPIFRQGLTIAHSDTSIRPMHHMDFRNTAH